VRPDLTQVDCKTNPKDYLGKIWVDSLVHDDKYLKFVLETMGKNRVILGSDYPFPCKSSISYTSNGFSGRTRSW
jgi:aminocarboxymuconate-semialdehyde decarboxylase